jgi:hypothetical protein
MTTVPGRRWEITTEMDFQDIGYGGVEWSDLAQNRNRWCIGVNMVEAS